MLAWLNLALQPCLMAMASTPEPAAAMPQVAHEHRRDCDHCPPQTDHGALSCIGSAASACGVAPDYSNDARSKLPEPKDMPAFVAIAALPPQVDAGIETDISKPPDWARLRFPGEPSLNVQFCVYLK